MASEKGAKPISILLVENEWVIAEDIKETLVDMGYTQTEYALSFDQALTMLRSKQPDILLLDIDLGDEKDRDGILLAGRVQQEYAIPVIFLTEHPVSTFRDRLKGVNKAGYLTKNFNKDNLHASIEIALDSIPQPTDGTGLTSPPELSIGGERFFLKKDNRYHCFHFTDLLYLQAKDAYCVVKFKEAEGITVSLNLKQVEEQINHPHLFRVHRSYAINVQHLTAFEGNMLFINEEEIPVGPKFRELLLSKLNILGRGGKQPGTK